MIRPLTCNIAIPLSLAVVLGLMIAGTLQGNTDQDCSECHSGTRPDGGYIFGIPEVRAYAPDNVTQGSTFQVLVNVKPDSAYELENPVARLDLSEFPQAETNSDRLDMEYHQGMWRCVFKVTCGMTVQRIVTIAVTVSYTIHHDHRDDQDPDIAYEESTRHLRIYTALEVDQEPEPQDVGSDTPLGALLPLIAFTIFPGVLAWRKASRRTR